MRRGTILAAAIAFTAPAIGLAEAPPVPAPGPEHRKLAGLVGNWTSEGECVANPLVPAEKWSTNLRNEAFKGGFAIVRHMESKGSVTGDVTYLEILTYDPEAKDYTWYGIDSTGWSGIARGSVTKDALKITWSQKVKGKTYKARGVLKGLGSDKLLWSMDYSEDGKTWKPACTATDVRVKGS